MRSPLGSSQHPLVRRLMAFGVAPLVKATREGNLVEVRMAALTKPAPNGGGAVALIARQLMARAPKVDSRELQIPRPDGTTLRLKTYAPRGAGRTPAFLHLHGGGFFGGSVEDTDPQLASLAHHSGVTVIAVDYRLALEHPFPAAIEDCMLALRWVRANGGELSIDPERIGLGGASAGGNLATVCALLARDEGLPLMLLALEVPVLDLTHHMPPLDSTPEYTDFFNAEHDFMVGLYAKDQDLTDPRLSPGLAPDLSGLPPTVMLACDCDPLVFQERDFVVRLREAGVSASFYVFPGLTHGVSALTRFLPEARAFQRCLVEALRGELMGMAGA